MEIAQPTTMSSKVRTSIFNLIDEYETNSGISPDQYYSKACYHPMAEGKYLSALSILFREKLISESYYLSHLKKAVQRLLENNFSDSSRQAYWGLGFHYKETHGKEPFLITTSIVAKGLIDNHNNFTRQLLKNTLNWLEGYEWLMEVEFKGQPLKVPIFSPNTRMIVLNPVAYWAGVLGLSWKLKYSQYDPKIIKNVMEWLLSRYIDPVGWSYSQNNNRVDLLHQFYIINSLFDLTGVQEIEEKALRVFNIFYNGGHMLDKIDITDKLTGIKLSEHSGNYSIYPGNTFWIVRFAQEARLWSYGEVLVALSRLGMEGNYQKYWVTMARRITDIILKKYPFYNRDVVSSDQLYFRDAMHLLHGLCSFLVLLRDSGASK